MADLVDQYRFRSKIVERLERDLVGPSGPSDELIADPPITRYVAGILYPPTTEFVDPAQDVDVSPSAERRLTADEPSAEDPSVAMANVRYPSSIGLTFAVDEGVSSVSVAIKAARYVPVEAPGKDADTKTIDPERSQGRRSAARARMEPSWRRSAIAPDLISVDIRRPTLGERREVADGLVLFHRVREEDAMGHTSVTLILINTTSMGSTGARDAFAWFQPSITVTAPDGETPAFVHRPGVEPSDWDSDLASNRLLYRHATSMGSGHGCSVEWDECQGDPTRAYRVHTTFVPQYELLLSDSNSAIPNDSLGMRTLAEGARGESLGGLRGLCDGYELWIEETRRLVDSLDPRFASVAQGHLDSCDEALSRVRQGVDLLGSDDAVWQAFQIANEAMLMQRARTEWLEGGGGGGGPTLDGDHRWRPFQIAFMLLCLEGVADPTSKSRDLADLLWFPTGGGKTEAYLGLLAFTIALRRLRDPARGHGVTVLMRYTLRLLTIQQFERATLLICCLESIRKRRSDMGSEAITIGLWVGQAATPNSLDDARTAIDKLRRGEVIAEGNPLQLQRCPWCATTLTGRSLYITKTRPRLVISCKADGCEFGSELPVSVVDDDLYSSHPALVIATSDKFASLPWKEACGNLFNLDLQGVKPPELIIQDELHLISGPLGTLAGLYESAIDILSTLGGIRPKVVASTATIRRAAEQTTGLFNRSVRQFPPPALDARNSYFSVESASADRASRLYIGCMAPGTSQTTLMVRTYAALLQGVAEEPAPADVKDPLWTLVGYFNSLRVLGGARMQVQDDVDDRLELLAATSGNPKRQIDNRIELTSRESSGDIPDHLRRMDIEHPADEALDVILATNMISVGVDINRLGLMVVMGQPQSTSEYIQATSRVGRRHPGLVVVMFNASKSRDRSHYESFVDYHSALYRQVESSSVTPFSARARDRALHAVLVALARLTIPGMRDNKAARDAQKVEQELRAIAAALVERVESVDAREAATTADELDEIILGWISRAEDEPNLVYRNQRNPDVALLGDASVTEEDLQGALPTLWSLRDVDQSSNLYQVQ